MRVVCATFGHSIAVVRVRTEHGIGIAAACAGDDLIETRITVGPEGTCACTMRVGKTHRNDIDGVPREPASAPKLPARCGTPGDGPRPQPAPGHTRRGE